LWVTGEKLRLEAGMLRGGKDIGSGAGFVTRALVTVDVGGPSAVMMLADVSAGRVAGAYVRLTGMQAACNAAMDLDGVPAGEVIGVPGDYVRQPMFSGGAWRTSAVMLGGIEALVEAVVAALVCRGRADDPHQLARIGRLKMAVHTAHLWLLQAAPWAEGGEDAAAVVAFVDLARLAVERAGLVVIQLAQQSLGLAGMVRGHPAERIMRDLATYLRQPAGDEALTAGARYFIHNDLPAP
jgi:alkylation response protein AidB-like acyl-CoA dehydrogenase